MKFIFIYKNRKANFFQDFPDPVGRRRRRRRMQSNARLMWEKNILG